MLHSQGENKEGAAERDSCALVLVLSSYHSSPELGIPEPSQPPANTGSTDRNSHEEQTPVKPPIQYLQYRTEKALISRGFHWEPLEVTILNSSTLEETTLKVPTVCSLCLPWARQNPGNWATDLECLNFHGQNTTSQHLQGGEFGYWRCHEEKIVICDQDSLLPWWSPFFWYMLLGSVSRLHSDGLSILSCWDGVSCSLYSQKYLRLPLFREDIAVISFKSSTESFSYPKRMQGVVYVLVTELFVAF